MLKSRSFNWSSKAGKRGDEQNKFWPFGSPGLILGRLTREL